MVFQHVEIIAWFYIDRSKAVNRIRIEKESTAKSFRLTLAITPRAISADRKWVVTIAYFLVTFFATVQQLVSVLYQLVRHYIS